MLAVLILQTLFEFGFHVLLVDMHLFHVGEPRLVRFMKKIIHILFVQPFQHAGSDTVFTHDPFEFFLERHIKLIKIRFPLDQYRFGHMVEGCQITVRQIPV